jgi:hypothetical protein
MIINIGRLSSPNMSILPCLLYDPAIKQFYVGSNSEPQTLVSNKGLRKINLTRDNINKLTFEHQRIELDRKTFELYNGWSGLKN